MAERPSFNYRPPVIATYSITRRETAVWKLPSRVTQEHFFPFLLLFVLAVRCSPGLRLQASVFSPSILLVSHRCSRACQACVIGSRRESSAAEEVGQTVWRLAGKEIYIVFVPLLLIRRSH